MSQNFTISTHLTSRFFWKGAKIYFSIVEKSPPPNFGQCFSRLYVKCHISWPNMQYSIRHKILTCIAPKGISKDTTVSLGWQLKWHKSWSMIALSGLKYLPKVVLGNSMRFYGRQPWCCVFISWQSPVQGLKCKGLPLMIHTALLPACQGHEAQKESTKGFQPPIPTIPTHTQDTKVLPPPLQLVSVKQSRKPPTSKLSPPD